MIIVPAQPSIGFDCDTNLSLDAARAFVLADMSFVVRYVSRYAPEEGDLSSDEVQNILDAGLALMIVQHAPEQGWSPSVAVAKMWAEAAVQNTLALNIPRGLTIWNDHEGVLMSSTPSAISAHLNAWSQVILDAGYQPGLYVGFDSGLNAHQLYNDLILTRYWKSASNVPAPAKRGFCMQQMLVSGLIANVAYDKDIVSLDYLGGIPNWFVAV